MLKLIALVAALQGRQLTATRTAADIYRLNTGDTVRTNACTVTANGMRVRLYREDRLGRPWIRFLDAEGRTEADCEITGVVK